MAHGSSDNLYGSETYIVDSNPGKGSHTTFALAMADAVFGDIVAARPGTYIENFSIPAGVRVTSIGTSITDGDVKIVGKITCSGNGVVEISNIFLQTNSDYCLVISGTSATRVRLHSCFIYALDNDAISFTSTNASANLRCYQCESSQASTFKLVSKTAGTGPIIFDDCNLTNGGGTITASTCSAGTLSFQYCTVNFPVSTSSSGAVNLLYSRMPLDSSNLKMLDLAATSNSSYLEHSLIESGSATAISVASGHTCHIRRCMISSDNASVIDGAGTIAYDPIVMGGTSSTLSATTQTILPFSPAFGSWVYLTEATASASSTIEFNSTYITSEYETYVIVYENIVSGTDNVGFQMQVSTDNGSTFKSTSYVATAISVGFSLALDTSTAHFCITDNILGNSTDEYASGTIYINGMASASKRTTLWGFGGFVSASGTQQGTMGNGTYTVNETINDIQFFMSSGNIASGTIKLYGLRNF